MGERRDLPIRRESELLLEQRLVQASVVQRPVHVARGDEGVHDAQRDAPVQRIGRGQLAPEIDRRAMITTRGRASRAVLQCPREVERERRTLRFHPSLEIGGPRKEESVQKRALV